MRTIGLFEGGAHEQYLEALGLMAQGPDTHLVIFTTEEKSDALASSQLTSASNITWVTKTSGESMASFVGSVQRWSSSLDVLVLVTIVGNLKQLHPFARARMKCRTLLYIYNINSWFNRRLSLRRNLADNAETLLKAKILRRIDALLVEYPQLQVYLAQRFPAWDKPVHDLQPVVYQAVDRVSEGERLVVAVPGNVDVARRDYDVLLEALRKVSPKTADQLQVRLLGPPVGDYGERVMRDCERLRQSGVDVVTHERRLGSAELAQQLADSHLLLCPLQLVKGGSSEGMELFGITKGSGSAFDAIRNGLPVVYPEYFLVPRFLRQVSLSYGGSSDIMTTLENFSQDTEYRHRLLDLAREASSMFTLEKQHHRFLEIVNGKVAK